MKYADDMDSGARTSLRFRGCVTYRRDMDWMLGLLTTCIYHLELYFTDH
jgi:hypothetical protein